MHLIYITLYSNTPLLKPLHHETFLHTNYKEVQTDNIQSYMYKCILTTVSKRSLDIKILYTVYKSNTPFHCFKLHASKKRLCKANPCKTNLLLHGKSGDTFHSPALVPIFVLLSDKYSNSYIMHKKKIL